MKQQLLILHGALGAKKEFVTIEKTLEEHYDVHTLTFDGHGLLSDFDQELSIEHFVTQTRASLLAMGWESPMVFGYSMGGYVALKLEAQFPGTFKKIVTLGTKFNWTPETAANESRMLVPEKIEEKVPAFAQYLASLHGQDNWKKLMRSTAEMMLGMGNNPPITTGVLANISTPTTCLRGEKDAMVTAEETQWAVSALQNARYEEVPNWIHPVNRIPSEELVAKLIEVL